MQQTQTYYQEVQTAFPGQNPLFLPLILFPGIYKGIKRVTIVHCWLQEVLRLTSLLWKSYHNESLVSVYEDWQHHFVQPGLGQWSIRPLNLALILTGSSRNPHKHIHSAPEDHTTTRTETIRRKHGCHSPLHMCTEAWGCLRGGGGTWSSVCKQGLGGFS